MLYAAVFCDVLSPVVCQPDRRVSSLSFDVTALLKVGDLSAWAYEYAVGIVPVEPGFRKVAFKPHFIDGVDSFFATSRTPHGEIRAGWRRVNGKSVFEYSVPEGVTVVKVSSNL